MQDKNLQVNEFGNYKLKNKNNNATFPLPHCVWTSAFAHRNTPRSLWLQHIHRMCRLTRRAHIPFPLCTSFEGTHGTAPRGDTLGTRIIGAFSLIMPLRFVRQLRNNTAQSLVLFVKLGARCGRRLATPTPNKHIPLISALRMSVRSDKATPSAIINY